MMFYHDGRHPLIYMYEPPMRKEEYEAAVDELVGTPIEALMFCLGDGRTVLHDTKVGELWGQNVSKWPHAIFRRAHQNARMLIDAGHDPLRVVCDRAHAKEMLLYPSLIVQGESGSRGSDVRGSNFRFDNPQLEIGARAGAGPKFPKDALRLMDFKHREAREERFNLIQETLSRYPVDGFELQLNAPHFFRPGEIEEGRKIMTAWIGEISRAVKASGADRELVVRVAASLEGCWSIGLDVREWVRLGIVDVVVPQAFVVPEWVDATLDFRPFVEAAKGSKTRIHAAIHSHVDSDRIGEAPIEMVRATACNYWAQGIDGLYLASWFNRWPYEASFYEMLREMPHPDIMAPKDKFYAIPTLTRRFNEPKGLEPGITMQLPAELHPGRPVTATWPVTDDLDRWNKTGRVHEVLLRVRFTGTSELDRFSFRFNGRPLTGRGLRKINETYKMHSPRYRVFGYWYVWRLDAGDWPVRGANQFEVTLLERDPDLTQPIKLRDVEMEVKYRMGKNFHRGQDPDLGPARGGSPD
jgi:hypothetical protein